MSLFYSKPEVKKKKKYKKIQKNTKKYKDKNSAISNVFYIVNYYYNRHKNLLTRKKMSPKSSKKTT